MKNGISVSYAASFGDSHFNFETYKILDSRLNNFKAIGIRESGMVDYISKRVTVPVKKVIDPTLLLEVSDYEKITSPKKEEEKYLLLYARRYNPKMEKFAQDLAKKNNLKVIEISLRATNKSIYDMRYESGVEEFLALVKNAEYVITNSFHGMIFSVQFRKQFVIFSREQCDTKIKEVLELMDLNDRMLINGDEQYRKNIDYDLVHKKISEARKESLDFLKMELELIEKGCK
jgi:exopolysaccharide biosynthesis predicted pyruvyltransferase EpsI